MKKSVNARVSIAIAALIAWTALILQFQVSLGLLDGDFVKTLKLFLSYFTVLTNIIVAICFTILCVAPQSKLGAFFTKASTLTAINVYILVVAVIYNLLLRKLISPTGVARVADELLHVAVPLLFFVFWISAVDKADLKFKSAITWLIYPLCYVVFVVTRGYFINQYPYPFINVDTLGYPKAFFNAALIILFFWLLSILLIFIGRKTAKVYIRY